MKKLDTSAISATVGLPIKAGTLVHLQSAYQEALSALGKALAGSSYDPTKMYVLNGCVNSGSGNNYIISAGSVFFNGEVYLVDATSFTTSGSNVAVGIIPNPPTVTTGLTFFSDVTADPVQFTDGVDRNVHQIRKCVIQSGFNGSGAANYLNWIDVTKRLQGGIGEIKMWKWPTGNYTDYFDPTGAGIHPYTIGWHDMNGQGGTIDMRGRMPVGWTPNDPDFSDPFNNVGGEKVHTLSMAELPSEGVAYKDRYWAEAGGTVSSAPFKEQMPNGYNARWGASNSDQDNDTFLYINSVTSNLGNGDAHNNMSPYRSVLWVQRVA